MHYQGDLEGQGPVWGYVKGGMGMVSFAIADAAVEAGAVLAGGTPVAEIVPGEGVRLEGGEFIRASVVLSNADPKRALDLLGARCRAGRVPRAHRGLAGPLAGGEAQRRADPAADVHRGRAGRPGRTASMISVTEGLDAAQQALRGLRAGRAAASATARSTSRPASTRHRRPRASTC